MPRLRYLARASPCSSSAFVASPLAAMMSPRVRNPWPCSGPRPSFSASSSPSRRDGFGRVGVEAEQRGCFHSKQLRFDCAISGRPRDAKGGLGDCRELARGCRGASVSPAGARRTMTGTQMNLVRSFESGLEKRDGGVEFTIESMSVPKHGLMPGQSETQVRLEMRARWLPEISALPKLCRRGSSARERDDNR